MTTNSHTSPAGPGEHRIERYRHVRTSGDQLIIYDLDVEEAWIQSDLSVSVDEMR